MAENEYRPEIRGGEATPVDHRIKILSLINTGRRDIIQMNTSAVSALRKEVHRFGGVEQLEGTDVSPLLEDIRLDICQSFGVPLDDEHVIRNLGSQVRGRTIKAFFILRNQKTREAWYADGNTDHAQLARELLRLAGVEGKAYGDDSREFDETFLTTKGFLDTNRFQAFPETRKGMEQALEFQDGKIETPENWFISSFYDSPHELGTVPLAEK